MIAIGLIGEPVPLGSRSGAMTDTQVSFGTVIFQALRPAPAPASATAPQVRVVVAAAPHPPARHPS